MPETPPGRDRPHLGYRPALDGFRAVAIVLVLLHHTGAFLVPGMPRWLSTGGFLGVDLFFVLSGFLITTLLLERRGRESHPIWRFYGRRALRLFPAVAVVLLVVVVYSAIAGHQVGRLPETALFTVGYAMNWAAIAGVEVSSYISQLWSLSVEEQFYLVWPLLLFGGLRLLGSTTRVAAGAVLLAAAIAVWRGALWEDGFNWLELYLRTDTHADGLFLGAAMALLPWEGVIARVSPRTATIVGAVALGLILLASELVERTSAFLYLGGFTLIALLTLVVIAALLRGGRLTDVFSGAAIVYVGKLSYSLYLWHFPVFTVLAEHSASWATGPRVVIGWALAFLAAWLSYRFVERPVLAYKRRLGAPAL